MKIPRQNSPLKILILSSTPWRNDNSFGNSFTNIFGGISDIELANIYCLSGTPDSDICCRYFQITEKMLVKNLLNRKCRPGREVFFEPVSTCQGLGAEKQEASRLMDFAKKRRWHILFWARDLIWKIGRWKSPELNRFVDDFNPDLIFLPLYYQHYMNDIGLYVKRRTGKKMVGYVSDDVYTWKQYSLSPLYWIDRFFKRIKIKSAVNLFELLYVISHRQQEEYQAIFPVPCKILYKGGYFTGDAPVKSSVGDPIKLVYTGNIYGGRWKTLAKIGEMLSIVNENVTKAQLDIYTLTPLTNTMRRKLDDGKNIFLKGSLAASQVKVVQEAADILVHVESFERKYLLETRLSFSTKIVDYLQRARCIFAVGSRDCASIDYIEKNDAGVIAAAEKEIYEKLRMLVYTPPLVRDYGYKAYACGSKNHQNEKIKETLKSDMLFVINNTLENAKGTLRQPT